MPPAETISVALSPEALSALRASVEAGEHPTLAHALDDAVGAWQRRRREDAGRLDAIRARIRRSLDDPRPDLTGDEVQAHLDALFAQAEAEARGA